MANTKYVKMDDYEKEDGDIDWSSYRAAEIANGERCKKCNSYISFPKGCPGECYECKNILKDEELSHDTFIRCPYCKNTWDPSNDDDGSIWSDGEHNVWCSECDKDFEMSTHVSFTFVSPKIKDENNNEDKPASQEGDSQVQTTES